MVEEDVTVNAIEELLEKSKNRIWDNDFKPGSMQLEAESVNRMIDAIE